MRLPPEPNFQSSEFLQQHVQPILDFYEPRVVSSDSGFHQCYRDTGEVFDAHARQLVGSARFVFNYATAYRLQGQSHYLDWARWGLKHLREVHKQPSGHYCLENV